MPRRPSRLGGATLLSLLFGGQALADVPLVRLEVGKPVERQTKGGTSDFTEFVLPAGGFARLQVDQRNAGIRISVQGPDGREIDWSDETGSYGSEFIAVLGGPAGVYKLEVRNEGPPDYQGAVLVTLVAAREGRPSDQRHLQADVQFRDANIERRKQGATSLRKAITLFDDSIASYQAVGDWLRRGESINRRGKLYLDLNEHGAALADFQEALALFESKGHRAWQATSLHNLGRVYLAQAQVQRAIELLEQALTIRREVGDADGQAYSLFNLGLAWSLLGETAKAIDLFEQTLPIHKAHYDQLGRIESWNEIARLQASTGAFQKALDNYDRVLSQAAGQVRNPQTLGASLALQGKARVYLALGDLDNAQAQNDRALVITRGLQIKEALASNLDLAGELHLSGGHPRRAVATFEESRALRKAASDRTGEAKALGRIGGALALLGDHTGALARFEEALAIDAEVGNKAGVAATLLLQSDELASLSHFEPARAAAAAALPLYRAGDDRLGTANALHRLAHAQRALGLAGEALQSVTGAIEGFESLRGLIDSPELRTRWRATTQGAFELLVELLMEAHDRAPAEGHDVRALLANERALARGLLETIGSSRRGLRQDVPAELLAQRNALAREANALEFRRVRALSDKAVTAPEAGALREVLAQARELEGKILAASPRSAAAAMLGGLSLEDVQRELDEDTLLLEFALGQKRSVLWLVSTAGVRTVELPARSRIEAEARALHAALTARNAAAVDLSVAARRARLERADGEAVKRAASLSAMLLGPVADALGRRRLVIVADGALRLIPFAALAEPGAPRRPLAGRHEIVSLPSAGVLAQLRRSAPLRPPPSARIAVIADPVYEATDARVLHGSKPAVAMASAAEVSRAALDTGLLGFPRLRFSRQEADALSALAVGTVASMDFAASREIASSPEVAQARIVHFATHSLMNTAHPELSGLVLSLVDERGEPRDGFLRLHEIYNLDLRADLVVLSACQTAVGKEFKGEGLVALTRGFLAAGSPRVIASLWNVDDQATSELMKRFYRLLLADKLSPGAALRAAQLEQAGVPRWKAAYYWAGFSLQGEWR